MAYPSINIGEKLNERIFVTVEVDGESKAFYLALRWQGKTEQWTMGIQDENGVDLVTHIPILSGVSEMSANLMRIFSYKGIGKFYVLPTDNEFYGADPTKLNLPTEYKIVWGDLDE